MMEEVSKPQGFSSAHVTEGTPVAWVTEQS